MAPTDIETLRTFALAHNEEAFAQLCAAAIAGEQWAVDRVANVRMSTPGLSPKRGDWQARVIDAIRATDVTRPDHAPADTREVTADHITDQQIRAYRDDHRWAGDADVVRCCSAALGLPTGDGALGLLDAATCRARLAPRIAGDRYYTIDAINARAKADAKAGAR